MNKKIEQLAKLFCRLRPSNHYYMSNPSSKGKWFLTKKWKIFSNEDFYIKLFVE